MICDICSTPGNFAHVSCNDVKKSVRNGFDPYALNIVPGYAAQEMLGISRAQAYQFWKTRTVEPDNSDWNLCPGCHNKLKIYL
jgi:hypothetical protein